MIYTFLNCALLLFFTLITLNNNEKLGRNWDVQGRLSNKHKKRAKYLVNSSISFCFAPYVAPYEVLLSVKSCPTRDRT